MFLARESDGYQTLRHHRDHDGRIVQMESCFCEHRFTGEEGLCHAARDADGPFMVLVVAIGESDEEAGVRDTLHVREKPLRVERFLLPRTVPASRMND